MQRFTLRLTTSLTYEEAARLMFQVENYAEAIGFTIDRAGQNDNQRLGLGSYSRKTS